MCHFIIVMEMSALRVALLDSQEQLLNLNRFSSPSVEASLCATQKGEGPLGWEGGWIKPQLMRQRWNQLMAIAHPPSWDVAQGFVIRHLHLPDRLGDFFVTWCLLTWFFSDVECGGKFVNDRRPCICVILLNYSMQQSPSSEANSSSSGRQIPPILWSPNVHHSVQNSWQLVPIPIRMQSSSCLPLHFLQSTFRRVRKIAKSYY